MTTARFDYPTVGSTNTVALERLGEGAEAPFWVTGGQQTAGRGRLGRSWVSEPGNLYTTLALRDPAPADRLPTLSIVAAVAVRRAIEAETGSDRLRLKWPNDVLHDGAKVAGLLLESHALGGHRIALVGCGINCATHPRHVGYPTTDLASAGYPVDATRLFAALDRELMAALAVWNRGERTQPFFDEWLANAWRAGERVTVGAPDGPVTGTLEGLDEWGRLRLATNDGLVVVTAGDLGPPRVE